MNELRDRPNSEDKGTRIGLIPSQNIWKIIAFNQFAWEILLIYYFMRFRTFQPLSNHTQQQRNGSISRKLWQWCSKLKSKQSKTPFVKYHCPKDGIIW